MSIRSMGRQGFTLVELMISMIITVIVGAALIRLTLGQVRFMDQQEAVREARMVSRSGINRLLTDLRALETRWGVQAAVAGGQDFTVRVPFAVGVICSTAGTVVTVSLLPTDDAIYAEALPGFSGYAWRNAAGTYANVPGVAIGAGIAANCQNAGQDSIHTLQVADGLYGAPAGRIISLNGIGIMPAPPRGSIVYLYRSIRYEFKDSGALPGRIGLWRTVVATGATEELAAPFDATARVNFYLNNAVAQADVPAQLSDIRGLELVLNGMSERAPGGTAGPKSSPVTTTVFFENRPD
jgi:prepilin-type N-terminal cleavage/methylation domain-containing protein